MDSVTEIWKPIPGFEFYEASNHGRVRSTDRMVKHYKGHLVRRPGKVLKGIPNRGYLVVKLGGPNKAYGVHQAVALAFHGTPKAGMVVNHINGIKTDNRPENLEWTTNGENVNHAYRTGLLKNHGEHNGRAILNDELVKKILTYPRTMTCKQVAAEVGCNWWNVVQVRSGRAWKHVPRTQSA